MTRELLEQYSDIVAEIEELKAKSQSTWVNVVQASSKSIPYAKHTVFTGGTKTTSIHIPRIQELEKQKAEILHFVNTRPTSKQRRILTHRILEGKRWDEVAAKMGYRYSQASLEKTYQRIFKK